MIKNAIAVQDDTDPTVTVEVDPDADDAEASTLLDSIVQGDQPEADTEEAVPEKPLRSASSPFLLESLYFRSFGERGLLEREEEIDLAKQLAILDHGGNKPGEVELAQRAAPLFA